MQNEIGSCRHFKMPGRDFAGEQRYLIALMNHRTLKSSTDHHQILLSFSWTQPTLQKHLQFPTYKTPYISLNSHNVSKLCSYLFVSKGENISFANKQKKCVYREWCLWSLKCIIQKYVVTALIANYFCNSDNKSGKMVSRVIRLLLDYRSCYTMHYRKYFLKWNISGIWYIPRIFR